MLCTPVDIKDRHQERDASEGWKGEREDQQPNENEEKIGTGVILIQLLAMAIFIANMSSIIFLLAIAKLVIDTIYRKNVRIYDNY